MPFAIGTQNHRRWIAALLVCGLSSVALTATAQPKPNTPTPLSGTKIKLNNTMNFKECLDYKLGICVKVCPSFFGAYPVIGLKPKYQEPTAVVETSCLKGETELGKAGGVNIIGGMLTGSTLKNPKEQKCAEGIKSPGSQITRNFDEAHVYGFSGLTRYFSSGSFMDATLSLSCGENGVAGSLTDYSSKANSIIKSGAGPTSSYDAGGDITTQLAELMSAETEVVGAPEERAVTAQSGGQRNDGNAQEDRTPQPISIFGTSVLGEVPETELVNGRLRATGRFLNTGPSQIAAETIEREFEAKVNLIKFYGSEATRLANEARNITAAGDLCNLKRVFNQGAANLAAREEETNQHGIEVYNNGTYLARDFDQEYDDKAASCPLVNAGYVLAPALGTAKGSTRRILNCEQVCDGERPSGSGDNASGGSSGKGSQCSLQPKLGFGGSCSAPLSPVRVENKYPACNGRVPEFRTHTDRDGNVTQTLIGYKYDARFDHRKQLNDARTATFKRELRKSKRAVNNAEERLDRRLNALQLSCPVSTLDVAPKPLANNKLMVPQFSLAAKRANFKELSVRTAQVNTGSTPPSSGGSIGAGIDTAVGGVTGAVDNAIGGVTDTVGDVLAPIDNAVGEILAPIDGVVDGINDAVSGVTSGITDGINNALGNALGDFQLGSAELDGLTESINSITALTRPGGVRQLGNNLVGQALPFGLYPAFISEATNWSEPPKFDLVGQIKQSIGSISQATLAPFTCLAPAHAADYGIGDGASLQKLNKLSNCIGTWGAEYPSTGWSFHKARPVSAALVGYRGHNEAVKFGAIQKNTKGAQQFNADYPFTKDGGKHKGSGCYNVGTGKPFYTESENLFELPKPSDFKQNVNKTLDVQDGKHVFTTWKKTSCCIWWCNGKQNIERYY